MHSFEERIDPPQMVNLMIVSKSESYLLVGGFNPTHLKNMRKSNWIMKPPDFRGENFKKIYIWVATT